MRKQGVVLFLVLGFMLFSSMVGTSFAPPPPIGRPMDFVQETAFMPSTVDYSVAYDFESGELIQNMMDTLVMFNGESTDQYVPSAATSWTFMPLGPGGVGIDSGIPMSGLSFENPDKQIGPNATYYYRYDFKIRPGIFFHGPYNYSLTGDDVVFSFQRTMLMDISGGPQSLIQEPLLDISAGSLNVSEAGQGGELTNTMQVAELGQLIQNAVQTNGTDVWFNLMFPGVYAPFMRTLTGTWSSIESKQWIDNQVCTDPARAPYEWDGNWPNATAWLTYRNPPYETYPLDCPTPLTYGSGPYVITTNPDPTGYNIMTSWSGTRNVNYFRGWPAGFLTISGVSPAGWVDNIYVTSTDGLMGNSIKSGAADFEDVLPTQFANVFKSSRPPYVPPTFPVDGVRDMQSLPTFSVNGFFFAFNINTSTPYGPIGNADTFNGGLIPCDFFGNPTWGVKVRKAFAEAFDYATYSAGVYIRASMSEMSHPATAIVPGLSYYDPSVAGFSYDLAAANASLNSVGPDNNGKMLKDVGFTMTLVFTLQGETWGVFRSSLLKSAIESLNPRYHINLVEVNYYTKYYPALLAHQLPMFNSGWAGYADPQEFAAAFYCSKGTFAAFQEYSSPAMDALVEAGINIPDGPARAQIYHDIQVLAVQDCPSFTISQYVSRHFERDWVVGWYYNPSYSGLYFYNLWKWYYVPASLLDNSTNPPPATTTPSVNLPADVNYDGKVDMKDIGVVARAFGAQYGPPTDPRWNFRTDVNNDRKIDMKDIGYVAKQFGKKSPAWPLPDLALSAPSTPTHGTPVSFTETITAPTGYNLTVDNVSWLVSQWPGPLVVLQNGQSLNFTYTFPAAGIYYVSSDVTYTVTTPYGNVTTSIARAVTVTVT